MNEVTLDKVANDFLLGGFYPDGSKHGINIKYKDWFKTFSAFCELAKENANLEQQNKEMLEALIKATKYMQIQRPFMNYSEDVELYENNIKIIESVTGKDIEEIIS